MGELVRTLKEYNVPVAGINLGHLGFLTMAERNDLSNVVKIFEGEYTEFLAVSFSVSEDSSFEFANNVTTLNVLQKQLPDLARKVYDLEKKMK